MTFTATEVTDDGGDQLHVVGQLTAAGRSEPIELDTSIEDASAQTATTVAHLDVDRTLFGMTWSPMRMTSPIARVDLRLRWTKASS